MSLFELQEFFEKVFLHLLNHSGEYFFFIGTTILSLQCLLQRAWLKATIFFLLGLLWISTYESTVGFFSRLGADSFHEAHSFDLKEALFWGKSWVSQFNFALSLKTFILYSSLTLVLYVCTTTLFTIFQVVKDKRSYINSSLAGVFIFVALYQSIWGTVDLFLENGQAFFRVKSNFATPPFSVVANPKLNVLLYIGESTSIMNMGLYGYPRPTTPRLRQLEREKGFIKFENVFSTHTHTSPSLLEALSIDLESAKDLVPIDRRRRVSFVDILDKANIPTKLYSNQGAAGTWNHASSIVFAAAKRTFSTENRLLGNADYKQQKPWDHDFFNKNLNHEMLDSSLKSMIVFHSYAGHGAYADNIPKEFRNHVDDYFKTIDPAAVTGLVDSLRSVEEYDSAIRYIDYAVSNALKLVKSSNKPWVFVYFADHGDAVFANRGHNSSQFIHEMARVPLIMFFNASARNEAPALFEKYSELAKTKTISTLAQFPSTLFDLFDATVSMDTLPVFGSPSVPAPILVRETIEGITAVNLSTETLLGALVDGTDSGTFHFVASMQDKPDRPLICYHRSNTIAKALRGSLVTNCLEIDIVVDDNSSVLAYHPPAKNTGLTLKQIFSAVKANNQLSFWLDGKNLVSGESCNNLLDLIRSQDLSNSHVLVEFPTGSHSAASEIRNCVEQLKSIETVHPSYYVPTEKAVACSKSLSNGKAFNEVHPCQELEEDLMAAKRSGLFTDFSFDYEGIEAIKALRFSSNFSWNTWHLKESELETLEPSRFRMVILTNDDPNNI